MQPSHLKLVPQQPKPNPFKRQAVDLEETAGKKEPGLWKDAKGIWHIKWRDAQGKLRKLRVGALKLARETLAKKRSERREEQLHPEKAIAMARSQLRYADLAERYREATLVSAGAKWAKQSLAIDELASEFFGRAVLASLTANDIERYRSWRASKGSKKRLKMVKGDAPGPPKPIGKATLNRDLARIRHVFELAVGDRLLERNPCKGVSRLAEQNERFRYLLDEEEPRLKEAMDPHDWDLVEFSFMTGLRQEEQFVLRWPDIDWASGMITVRKSKSGKGRKIHFGARVRAILERLRSIDMGPFVFMNIHGPRQNGDPSKRKACRTNPHNFYSRKFLPALEKAGIDGMVWHDLRHTTATRMVRAGVDLITVRDHMGHSSIVVTQRYANMSPDHRKDAVNKMG